MDKDSTGRTSGERFYYLLGDIARLHEAAITYARDYMIENNYQEDGTIKIPKVLQPYMGGKEYIG